MIRHKPFMSVKEHNQYCEKLHQQKIAKLNEKPEELDDGKNKKITEFLQ